MSQDTHYTPHLEEHPDAWHRHTLSEGMPQREHAGDVNVRGLLAAFAMTSTGVVVVVVVIIMYYRATMAEARRERIETTVLAGEANRYREQSLEEIAAARSRAFDEVIATYGAPGDGGGDR